MKKLNFNTTHLAVAILITAIINLAFIIYLALLWKTPAKNLKTLTGLEMQ